MKENTLLDIQPEVKAALDAGKAVVALESTIISHGMPYPQNIQMAKKVESIIRSAGAVPATVAIMDGKIKIGLSDQELEVFASFRDVAKVSRRDFPGRTKRPGQNRGIIFALGRLRATSWIRSAASS